MTATVDRSEKHRLERLVKIASLPHRACGERRHGECPGVTFVPIGDDGIEAVCSCSCHGNQKCSGIAVIDTAGSPE